MARRHDVTRVRAVLEQAGYPRAQQAVEFPVWLQDRDVARLDLVAFARPSPRDMTTATIVCDWSSDLRPSVQTRLAAGALAAPIVLTANNGRVAAWPTPTEVAQPIVTVDAAEPADVIKLLRPELLLAAKIGHRQLPLFPEPVDLLQAARTDRSLRLEPLLSGALSTAVEYYSSRQKDAETAHKMAARLVIGALTTLVLRDKCDLRDLDVTALLTETAGRFPQNFDWITGLKAQDRRLLQVVLGELGEWIDYTSLDPGILSEVYESALVADEERAELGIHYTPPGLARRLLSELPVEVIAPEERHVLDPACGSGTLLVAAHDRLRALQPPDWPDRVKHEDLRVHLRGIDIDPFAAEIARLALLLNAMPAGNGWHVENRDSLSADLLLEGTQPSIIVANPPWRHRRGGGEAVERADAFVLTALRLLRPGGLLAVLLPQSWLDSNASSDARQALRSSCDLFETWSLPIHTFPTSAARAAAVLARKRSDERGHRLMRVIRPGGLARFMQSGRADETYILPPDEDPNSAKPLLGPLSLACAELTAVLDDVANVLTGPQPRSGIRSSGGGTPYLDSFREVAPYSAVRTDQVWGVDFPEDFQTARGATLIRAKKVLVSALRLSDGPWCVKAALDEVGIAVRNSVHMVAPRDQTTEALYALFAFVASGFFNCWIDEHSVGVNIPTSATRSAPLPFGEAFVSRLAGHGRAIAAASGDADPETIRALLLEGERLVWQGFEDVPDIEKICSKRLAGSLAPEGQERYASHRGPDEPAETALRRFGYVMEVSTHAVRLWVNGLTSDDGVWIDVPARMPGYLLRDGASFDVTEYADGLQEARFQLQSHSYEDVLATHS
jgi:SAM-dependent methyltransferase